MVRGKFRLNSIDTREHEFGSQKTYVFMPVCDDGTPENAGFAKSTPSGEFRMVIDNPAAQAQFSVGKYYYFDATPVPAPC